MDSREFLGRGIGFPFRVDRSTGKIAMAHQEEDIRQAIEVILRTQRGERVMRPGFGTRIMDYVFEENTRDIGFALERDVFDALTRWEPRIRDIEVAAEASPVENAMNVRVQYTVRSTNNMFNVVYPFYLMEGIGLEGAEEA